METAVKALVRGQDARLSPTWLPSVATLFEAGALRDVLSNVRDTVPHAALAMHDSIPKLNARTTHNEALAADQSGAHAGDRNGDPPGIALGIHQVDRQWGEVQHPG